MVLGVVFVAVETFLKGVLTAGTLAMLIGTFFLWDLVPLLVRCGPYTGTWPGVVRVVATGVTEGAVKVWAVVVDEDEDWG